MARTSCVREFNAMTVGSFRTMPRPRVYTRVLAVPRSMARSLARLAAFGFGRGVFGAGRGGARFDPDVHRDGRDRTYRLRLAGPRSVPVAVGRQRAQAAA